MERYIGLDPHGTSCTFGVIGPSGRKLRTDVVKTNGAALVSYLWSLPGRKHLCLEEGRQSAAGQVRLGPAREAPDEEVSVHSMQIGGIVSLSAETATVEPRIVTCRGGAAAVARTGPGKPSGDTRFDGFAY